MENNDKKIIKEASLDLLNKMGFKCFVDVVDSKEDSGVMMCNVIVEEDSNLLIGQKGVNLEALQQIIRVLAGKKAQKPIRFVVDVNSYRAEKNQSVIESALSLAKHVIEEKRSIVMRPMSAFERRLVHMALEGNGNVSTESIGEGEDRKIVIKPVNSLG